METGTCTQRSAPGVSSPCVFAVLPLPSRVLAKGSECQSRVCADASQMQIAAGGCRPVSKTWWALCAPLACAREPGPRVGAHGEGAHLEGARCARPVSTVQLSLLRSRAMTTGWRVVICLVLSCPFEKWPWWLWRGRQGKPNSPGASLWVLRPIQFRDPRHPLVLGPMLT